MPSPKSKDPVGSYFLAFFLVAFFFFVAFFLAAITLCPC